METPLKKIDEELLDQLQYYAGLMFSRKQIAIILELSPEDTAELLESTDSESWRLMQIGRLKCEAIVRKSIFDLAGNGSSPAQAFAMKLIENAKMDDV
jgi:hypothetical protein